MRAEQIMTTDVTTVHADTTIEEVARLIATCRIGSVPVVDDDQHRHHHAAGFDSGAGKQRIETLSPSLGCGVF
jgi:CBS-domain-containing membrane protein